MDSLQEPRKKRVIVLGAGVIGLTTTLQIQEKGDYQVEIVADVLPTDPKTIRYTSHWAGAHYVSYTPSGTEESDIDHATFLEMWRLSVPGSQAEECFLRLSQTEYLAVEQDKPSPFERMPGFREVSKEELIPGATCGYSFETVTIDTPVYLNYLTKRIMESGVILTKGHVQHIDQILEAGSVPFREHTLKQPDAALDLVPDAVIICAGLGARFLGGVEDESMYPSRGQTLILHAPWIRHGCSLENGNIWTYIIPRKSGDVVVGGIQGIDDWYPKVRPDTRQDLLQRGLSLCPQLIPPEMRKKGETSGVEVLTTLLVDEGCGLRPMRKGGPRRELEYRIARKTGKRVPIIHNYGHGTQGYIQSIGSAQVVLRLLEEALLIQA